ncbi:hypothetical protein [Spongiivirga citrea]|uniref:Uncharacterized protein n=1 Tax=Spongiivirga citrea TaxID=1481457 RepID=A0A6M0CF98_9FLAO|nr:hypothetical protein [Spongiivirga citrea]NER16451.1 hypothetical protein [Spongiivirga citrea]
MLKKLLKLLLILVAILLIGGGYLFFRLHNDIANVLQAENDWRSEVLEFPLIFASDIEYEGEEHIRFAPGWGEKDNQEYFSYVFLWMIEENPNLNSSKLESIVNEYFDGLMGAGAITNFSFFKEIPETKTSLEQITENTFTGSIQVYDEFFKKELIILNTDIKTEYCLTENKYLVWFYLSPQEESHQIWNKLKEVNLNINCH